MKRTILFMLLAFTAPCGLFTDDAGAHPGWGIVVDRQGQICFSDVARNCVWRIDAQGKLTAFLTGKHSHQLVIDEDGNIYGEHLYYDAARQLFASSLWKIAPQGTMTTKNGEGLGSTMDRSGNLYYWNGNNNLRRGESQILRKTPEGKISVVAGSDWGYADGKGSAAKFSTVGGTACGPDGSLYLTDGSAVRRVMTDGTVKTLARDLLKPSENPGWTGLWNRLMGLAVDEQGNVYVADSAERRLLKITSDGNVATVLRARWLWAPTGVTLAGGDIYVLENQFIPGFFGPRVQKISPNGRVTTLATVVDPKSLPIPIQVFFFLGMAVAVVGPVLAIAALVVFVRAHSRP